MWPRFLTGWLQRVATFIRGVATFLERLSTEAPADPLQQLAARFPGAPEHWLRDIASRAPHIAQGLTHDAARPAAPSDNGQPKPDLDEPKVKHTSHRPIHVGVAEPSAPTEGNGAASRPSEYGPRSVSPRLPRLRLLSFEERDGRETQRQRRLKLVHVRRPRQEAGDATAKILEGNANTQDPTRANPASPASGDAGKSTQPLLLGAEVDRTIDPISFLAMESIAPRPDDIRSMEGDGQRICFDEHRVTLMFERVPDPPASKAVYVEAAPSSLVKQAHGSTLGAPIARLEPNNHAEPSRKTQFRRGGNAHHLTFMPAPQRSSKTRFSAEHFTPLWPSLPPADDSIPDAPIEAPRLSEYRREQEEGLWNG